MDGALIAAAAALFGIVAALASLIWRLSSTATRLEMQNIESSKDIAKLEKLGDSMTRVVVHDNDIAALKDSVAKLSSLFTQLRIKQERADEREEQTEKRASQGDYR